MFIVKFFVGFGLFSLASPQIGFRAVDRMLGFCYEPLTSASGAKILCRLWPGDFDVLRIELGWVCYLGSSRCKFFSDLRSTVFVLAQLGIIVVYVSINPTVSFLDGLSLFIVVFSSDDLSF